MVVGIPTLGSQEFITKPQLMMAYVLRYYTTAPKSTSNTHYDQKISLTDTLSRYGNDMSAITGPVRVELLAEFTRLFPDASIEIDVTTTSTDNVTYELVISPIVTMDGMAYTVDKTVSIKNGVLYISNDIVTPST